MPAYVHTHIVGTAVVLEADAAPTSAARRMPASPGTIVPPAPVTVEYERHQNHPKHAREHHSQHDGNPAMEAKVGSLEPAHDPDEQHDQGDEAQACRREADHPAHHVPLRVIIDRGSPASAPLTCRLCPAYPVD